MKMKSIGVAFAVNEAYLPHLEIALFSLLANGRNSFYEISVLSFDMKRSSKDKLKKICKHFGNASIDVIHLDSDSFRNFKILEHFSKDMYSRYLLAELLPNRDRVLYLDADILITDDLSRLYNIDIDGFYAAAVRDFGISQDMFRDYLVALELHDSPYFNSGVLLLNLAKIRRDNKVQALISETQRLHDKIRHPDQDIINLVFKGKIKPVDGVWNYQDDDRRTNRMDLDDAVIIHYTSGNKPWNTPNSERGYNGQSHHLYEQYAYRYLETFGSLGKVSVVIPVYDTSREYLKECVGSVLGQIYRNIEVILVDDGSQSDDTLGYLSSIAEKDERLVIIHKDNEGTNMARCDGFKQSTGDYVTFVDSDDSLAPNFIYKLHNACTSNRAEIAICESWDEDIRPIALNPLGLKTRCIQGKDELARFALSGFPDLRINGGVVWGKIYRRDVLNTVDWSLANYRLTEDEFISIQVFSQDLRVVLVGEQLYYYRRHVSTSKEFSLPECNTFNGKDIPMVRTADDLFDRTVATFNKNNVNYSHDDLLRKYTIMIDAQVRSLLNSGSLSMNNRQELGHQSRKYMPLIMKSEGFTDEEKIRIAITLACPDVLVGFDGLIRATQSTHDNLQSQVDECYEQNIRMQEELSSFLGLGRSLRLVAGNLKRKLTRGKL